MAGTFLGEEGWVVSDENGEATLSQNGDGTGAGPEMPSLGAPQLDTDADSWDSGDNQPDVMDPATYEGDVSTFSEETEGDEDDLGDEPDGEPDPDEVNMDLGDDLLDDEEIDDRTFDCD